jgi:hypothetical protein
MAGSFSDYWELKILDATFGDPDVTITAPTYLALCTTEPTDASTGATLVEAGYTGYARKAVAASDMSAASGTNPAQKTNSNAITFDACSGSSSVIVGWALCDASGTGAGNVLAWGSATSTTISITQTPATVGVGGLVVTLD